jgi:hypothetical protein
MSNHIQTNPPSPSLGALNHPTREEWVALLYGEAPTKSRPALNAHLQTCPACQAQVDAWRRTMKHLDAWSLSKQSPAARAAWPALKWGIAALLVLGLGFGAGRFSAPTPPSLETIRASLAPTLQPALESALRQRLREDLKAEWQGVLQTARAQMQDSLRRRNQEAMDRFGAFLLSAANSDLRQCLAEFVQANDQERANEYQTLMTGLRQFEAQRLSDYADLRQDLETLALTAEGEIHRTRQDMAQLISAAQPAGRSSPADNY